MVYMQYISHCVASPLTNIDDPNPTATHAMFVQITGVLAVIALANADGCARLIEEYRSTPVTYPFPYNHGPHQGDTRYELGPPLANVYELVRFELGSRYVVDDGKVVLVNGDAEPLVLSKEAAEDQWGPEEGWQHRISLQEDDVGVDWDDEEIDDELVDEFLRSFCSVTLEN